jgi:hypothetical protein
MLVLLLAAVGASWTITRCLGQPDLPAPAPTAVESRRAQHKLVEIFQRPRSPGGFAAEPVVFSEVEINALLARNIDDYRGAQLRGSVVRLVGNDRVDVYRSLPLPRALDAVGLGALARYFPGAWREHRVWWRISTRVRNADRPDRRRAVVLDVEGLAVGNQPVPLLLTRVVLDQKLLDTLTFDLPAGVDAIAVEPGKVVVRRVAPIGLRPGLDEPSILSLARPPATVPAAVSLVRPPSGIAQSDRGTGTPRRGGEPAVRPARPTRKPVAV